MYILLNVISLLYTVKRTYFPNILNVSYMYTSPRSTLYVHIKID